MSFRGYTNLKCMLGNCSPLYGAVRLDGEVAWEVGLPELSFLQEKSSVRNHFMVHLKHLSDCVTIRLLNSSKHLQKNQHRRNFSYFFPPEDPFQEHYRYPSTKRTHSGTFWILFSEDEAFYGPSNYLSDCETDFLSKLHQKNQRRSILAGFPPKEPQFQEH